MYYKQVKMYFLVAVLACSVSASEVTYVDLSPVINVKLEDDGVAGNGVGGWTDDGANDFFVYPPLPIGEATMLGYRFCLVNPKEQAQGFGAVMLRGAARGQDKAAFVTQPISPAVKAKYVFALHACVMPSVRYSDEHEVYWLTLHYADGERAELTARYGREIAAWWKGLWWVHGGQERWPVYTGVNSASQLLKRWIALGAGRWENPFPEKEVVRITMRSAGRETPVIFAITLSNEDFAENQDERGSWIKRPPVAPEGYFREKKSDGKEDLMSALRMAGHLQGIIDVQQVHSSLLRVELGAAFAAAESGAAEQAAAALQRPDHFSLHGADGREIRPVRVGRYSYMHWSGQLPMMTELCDVYHYNYYLQFDTPLPETGAFELRVSNLPEELRAAFPVNLKALPQIDALKVNQLGYFPEGPKVAYLGCWAGDFGAIDFSSWNRFELRNADNGKTVFEGDCKLRSASDPLSGEAVWELDFSRYKKNGRYQLVLPGLGRSAVFSINEDLYDFAETTALQALTHLRHGYAVADSSWPRKDLYAMIFAGGRSMDHGYQPLQGEPVQDIRGGHRIPGDLSLSSAALPALERLLLLCEVRPDSPLNAALLAEVAWGLKFYSDRQRLDGSVPCGLTNGGSLEELCRLWRGDLPPYGILTPTTASSFSYAALAARFSRALRAVDPVEADRLLRSARQAYAWARLNPGVNDVPVELDTSMAFAWAAGSLFAVDGAEQYQDDFLSLYHSGTLAENRENREHWCMALWPYASNPRADSSVRQALQLRYYRAAEDVRRDTQSGVYRSGSGSRIGGMPGTLRGGGRYAEVLLRSYLLKPDKKWLVAATLNADYLLGANPLSRPFMTGLSDASPRNIPLLPFMINKDGLPVAGMPVRGPGGKNTSGYPVNVPPARRYSDRISAVDRNGSDLEDLTRDLMMFGLLENFWR